MQEKWLIAVDLDGTLFHPDHQVSSRTLDALHAVIDRGHSLVIITGRSSHSAIPKLQAIPDGSRLVCSNGAYEYDRVKQSIAWAHYLSAALSNDIRQRIIEQHPTASFGWESALGLSYEPEFLHEAGGAHTLEQGGLNEASGSNDVLKMFVRTPERNGGKLSGSLKALLGEDAEVSSSGAPFAEITAAGINKGKALAKVASDLDFQASRTIAFGDNQNDAPMLNWAGESVAMGNAIDEVKAMTTSHTLSNAEDGVAHFLETNFIHI